MWRIQRIWGCELVYGICRLALDLLGVDVNSCSLIVADSKVALGSPMALLGSPGMHGGAEA